jgi:glycosyltransferase involved in cell wall biosynthesis/GT2 family glycosyltransferase
MKVTWTTFAHNFTSAGVIANNVIIELTKLGIDVGYNAINRSELNDDDIKSFPPEVQEALKKGLREDSINIFFSYPDIYPNVRCKVNVGYTGADSSGWYYTGYNPAESCNNNMDYMLTPSDYSRQIMKNCGVTTQIDLFPHGIDTNLFKPIKRCMTTPFTFLYTGELSERKGTQDLIKTFKEIYLDDQDFKLVLRANSHMLYYGGVELYNSCRYHENIEVHWKDQGQEEIVNYFNDANMYVYPSRADWFGMTPFEAIATGLPTIATMTNGYYEYLKDYILKCEYKEEEIGDRHPYLKGNWNSPDLNKLKWLMNLPKYDIYFYNELCNRFYGYALKVAKDFTWENVTKQYLLPFLEKVHDKHFKSERKSIVDNKRVTVGIPTKDRLVELTLLLQSLLNQTYKEFDVLIIDDCNPGFFSNGTLQAMFKLLKEFGHDVKVIKGERRGPHIAGHKILNYSDTELILRLDDDVSLLPTFIEELVSLFNSDDVGAVGPVYLNPHEPLKNQVIPEVADIDELELNGLVYWNKDGSLFLTGYLQNNTHSNPVPLNVEHLNSGFMYRKSAGLKIGGYCLELSPVGHREESDFSYRLFREGYKLFINPKSIAYHFHPTLGGIRETNGVALAKSNWDHDEKIFLDRMEKWLPKDEAIKDDKMVSVIILTNGMHNNLKLLLKDIETYTNHYCEYIIFNNDTSEESMEDASGILLDYPNLNMEVVKTTKELSVSEARNEAIQHTSDNSKYICFIDDNARILGRYNQTTDWVDYLFNIFHEESDVGAVGPLFTFCNELMCNTLSAVCLFTSKKVWEVVGGFDCVFNNKKNGTFGWEDIDWSYRCILRGFKLLGVKGRDFPFYYDNTISNTPEIESASLKSRELILQKYRGFK